MNHNFDQATKQHYDNIYDKVENIIFENLDLDEYGKPRN